MRNVVRAIGIVVVAAIALSAVVADAVIAQTASPIPVRSSTDASTPPAVLERPDLTVVWQPGMTLRYHRTSPGKGEGDSSRLVMEEFTKADCPRSPCSKWHGYFPKPKDAVLKEPEVEAYEYFDGDGNLIKLTAKNGRSLDGCYPRVLRFPLKVPGDATDGCSSVGFNGNGTDHRDYSMHYEWERVRSTYTGADPVWAVHVTIKTTCGRCQMPGIYHRYYYPQKAVWLLRVEDDNLYDLTSIIP